MYKKLFISISLVALSLSLNLSAAQGTQYHSQTNYVYSSNISTLNHYSPEFTKAIQLIHQVPEARDLIAAVQKGGMVQVRRGSPEITKQSGACWEAQSRTIFLNMNRNHDVGEMVNTIIFELHNALATSRLENITDNAADGHIEKDEYVEQIERTEYNNALRTSQLLEKGIERGIFPESARWPVPKSFDDHYRLQQVHGHSQQIAMQFDQFSPRPFKQYRGTIPGLHKLSQQDRNDLMLFFSIKHDLESGSQQHIQRGMQYLRAELNKIDGCRSGTYVGDCSRIDRKEYLMNLVLDGNSQFEQIRG